MSIVLTVLTSTLALMQLQPVPFNNVQISDKFWAPRQETNRKVSIAHSLDMLDKFGYMKNFELAAQGKHEGYSGPIFMDSDVYKALEAASFSLATHPDLALGKRLDGIIAKIAAAQTPEGYLNSAVQVQHPDKRFTNLRDWHELYCAGHLFEAAVAHFQATGKRTLLNIAVRNADYIDTVFGDQPGKRQGYCGHPEIELALVKLFHATGEKRYLALSEFMLRHRGDHFFVKEHGGEGRFDEAYYLDDQPITEHSRIKGHAVRAAYLMSGATDIGGETGNQALLDMVQKVWKNTDERNTYVTGGIGPSAANEGFTEDYDLPNESAYQETCASVALAMWNHRLGLLYADAKYVDRVERSLYNGVLSGVSLSGDKFFYVNPLASAGHHHRSEWFSCACCPPNETRTLASLGGYAYSTAANRLYVNLFIQGTGQAKVGGKKVDWQVQTNYPWEGKVSLTLQSAGAYGISLRIPGWCERAKISRNGKNVAFRSLRGYAELSGPWKAGDVVELDLPMPVRRVSANPRVQANRRRLALARGPLVYCLEQADQKTPVADLWLPAENELTAKWQPGLLGGVTTLSGMAKSSPSRWQGGLYATADAQKDVPIVAVPYYAWDNRDAGAMAVWLPISPAPPVIMGAEADAKVSMSFVSDNCSPGAVKDGFIPAKSSDTPASNCHWWPHKGGTEWVQYDWAKPVSCSSAKVFWFDDSGVGECRLPSSWRLLAKIGEKWKEVALTSKGYPVFKDAWCTIAVAPIKVRALRLELQMQEGWAAGIHEWKVEAEE